MQRKWLPSSGSLHIRCTAPVAAYLQSHPGSPPGTPPALLLLRGTPGKYTPLLSLSHLSWGQCRMHAPQSRTPGTAQAQYWILWPFYMRSTGARGCFLCLRPASIVDGGGRPDAHPRCLKKHTQGPLVFWCVFATFVPRHTRAAALLGGDASCAAAWG